MVKDVTPTPKNHDEQQSMQALKQYGGYIVMAIVVALGGYFGWQYYQQQGGKVDYKTAQVFENIQKKQDNANELTQKAELTTEEKTQLENLTKELEKELGAFISMYPDTVYTWQALMLQAKQQMDKNDFTAAIATFKQASEMPLADDGLKTIAKLRHAQVLLDNGQADDANHVLQTVNLSAFETRKQELLADIAMSKNDKTTAIAHYQKAWQALEQRNETLSLKQDRALLRMKMESVGLAPAEIDVFNGVISQNHQQMPEIDIQNQESLEQVVSTATDDKNP